MPPYILRGKAYPRSLCALGSFNGEFVSVPRHELPNHQTPPSCCSGWSPCLARRRAGLGIFTRTTAALGFSHRVFTLHDLGWTRPGPSLDGSSALMSALFAVQWLWSLTPIYHALIGCPSGCNTLRGRSVRNEAQAPCACCRGKKRHTTSVVLCNRVAVHSPPNITQVL